MNNIGVSRGLISVENNDDKREGGGGDGCAGIDIRAIAGKLRIQRQRQEDDRGMKWIRSEVSEYLFKGVLHRDHILHELNFSLRSHEFFLL